MWSAKHNVHEHNLYSAVLVIVGLCAFIIVLIVSLQVRVKRSVGYPAVTFVWEDTPEIPPLLQQMNKETPVSIPVTQEQPAPVKVPEEPQPPAETPVERTKSVEELLPTVSDPACAELPKPVAAQKKPPRKKPVVSKKPAPKVPAKEPREQEQKPLPKVQPVSAPATHAAPAKKPEPHSAPAAQSHQVAEHTRGAPQGVGYQIGSAHAPDTMTDEERVYLERLAQQLIRYAGPRPHNVQCTVTFSSLGEPTAITWDKHAAVPWAFRKHVEMVVARLSTPRTWRGNTIVWTVL